LIYQWYIYQKHINKPAGYYVHITRWCQPHQWYVCWFCLVSSHHIVRYIYPETIEFTVICTAWRSQICRSGEILWKTAARVSGWWCNNHLEKYESQWEGLSHILWKIKNDPNHQPVIRLRVG
jgi:hypothetical protein